MTTTRAIEGATIPHIREHIRRLRRQGYSAIEIASLLHVSVEDVLAVQRFVGADFPAPVLRVEPNS